MRRRKTKIIAALLASALAVGNLLMPAAENPVGTGVETVYADTAVNDGQMTAQNVSKILSYANQLKNSNTSNRTTGRFTWDTENKSRSWTYYNGLMMDAFAMVSSGNYSYVDAFYNANISSDGTIANFNTGQLDSVEPIRAAFDMFMNSGYTSSNANKYKQGIQKVYTMLENQISYSACGGNYAHKQESNGSLSSSWSTYPIALDGIYMAQPFLMECARAIDAGKLTLKNKNGQTVTSSSIYNSVYSRLVWIYNNLYNSNTHLFDHASNTSGQTNGISWSRAIGWYAMALVDCIEMMPEGSMKQNLITELPRLFDGLIQYQDSQTGLWYNVTAYNGSLSGTVQNKLETSGSSQFAYAMMKSYNNGYVTDERYAEAGLKAFNGVVNNKLQGSSGNFSVVDTYISSGASTNPTDYLSKSYTTNEAKGVGALIMAATLANSCSEKLASAKECVSLEVSGSYKDSYLVGESLDLNGLVVYAVYNNGERTIVTDYTVSELPSVAGSQTITITYENVTETIQVEVHEASDEWITIQESSCMERGIQIRRCKACDLEMDRREMELKDHYVAVLAGEAPTCTETGWSDGSYCDACGTILVPRQELPALGHTAFTVPGTEVSCTQDGLTEGSNCSVCGVVLSAQEVIRASGHTIVTDKSRAATCTREGLTEGKHCSVCGEVLAEQKTIPALGHTVVTVEGIPATCTEYGLTDESWCSVCGEVFQELDLIPYTGHTVVVTPAVAATCTSDGLTAGTHCSVCNKVLQKQNVIVSSGHVPKVTEGYSASCTTNGLTDSSVCYFCGITLQEAEVIPAIGHVEVIDPAVEPADCTTDGHTESSHCGVCGLILKPYSRIPAPGHTPVTDSGVNTTCTTSGWTAGQHCETCGEVIQERIFIPAPGHSVKTDPYVAATCTEDGKTEGSHCLICGLVFVEQEVIPATGHTAVKDEAIPATCSSIGYTEGSHCSVCNRTLQMQKVVDKKNHEYTVVPGEAPGLFKPGYTSGMSCKNCGKVLVKRIEIPAILGWLS